MNPKNHHAFTLWIFSQESDEKVPAMIFDEASSFEEVLLTMMSLDQLGLCCSLTCDTWTEFNKDESVEVKND